MVASKTTIILHQKITVKIGMSQTLMKNNHSLFYFNFILKLLNSLQFPTDFLLHLSVFSIS